MSFKHQGELSVTFSLEYTGVPSGNIWYCGVPADDRNPITVQRLNEVCRQLYGLAPEVTFTLKYQDDEGAKIPLVNEGDMEVAYSYRSPTKPLRVMCDLPAPPGTPLPPIQKKLREEKCTGCSGSIRGLGYRCFSCVTSFSLCQACHVAGKGHTGYPHTVGALPFLEYTDQLTSRGHEYAHNSINQGLCPNCKGMVRGLRYQCCECKVWWCERCEKLKKKPTHDPTHHMCPVDDPLSDDSAFQDYAREYLQNLQSGTTQMVGAAGLLLGMPPK